MIKRITLLALPLLAACATTVQAEPSLIGTKWVFVSIDGKAPVSDRTELTIEQGRIGANVGCNGMGSDLRIEGDRLITNGVISTKMFCDAIAGQEMAVGALLDASPSYRIEGGRLILTSPGHRVELRRAN
ncbi:MAG TPA: META domain-containing protein [Novosphingobium sp.]|nr:META domain-containing protein [Novosphingobium sp.]